MKREGGDMSLLRAFVGGLTIGLFLCLAQSAVNAQAGHCPPGKCFVLGSASTLLVTGLIAGDAEYRAELAKCVRTAYA